MSLFSVENDGDGHAHLCATKSSESSRAFPFISVRSLIEIEISSTNSIISKNSVFVHVQICYNILFILFAAA